MPYLTFATDCVAGTCEFSDVRAAWVCEVTMKLPEVSVEKRMLHTLKSR